MSIDGEWIILFNLTNLYAGFVLIYLEHHVICFSIVDHDSQLGIRVEFRQIHWEPFLVRIAKEENKQNRKTLVHWLLPERHENEQYWYLNWRRNQAVKWTSNDWWYRREKAKKPIELIYPFLWKTLSKIYDSQGIPSHHRIDCCVGSYSE